MRLKAPFWLTVSVLLLLFGLVVVDSGEAKGRIVFIAVGAFGALCSIAVIVHGQVRSRRDLG